MARSFTSAHSLASASTQVAASSDAPEVNELRQEISAIVEKHGVDVLKTELNSLFYDLGKADKMFLTSGDREFTTGEPTAQQMRVINSKLPGEVDPSEIRVATFAASHNLISISKGVWDLESLQVMAKKFPEGKGRPFEIDHHWYSSEASKGNIFDARLMRSNSAPKSIQNFQDFGTHNKKIVARDGFIWLEIDVFYEAASQFAQDVKYGRVRDVSTGGLKDPNGIACPICSEEHNELVMTFTDDRCPHIPPLPYMSWFLDLDDPEIAKRMMPYFIRCGFHTAIEVSSVLVGDLPGAQIMLPSDRW